VDVFTQVVADAMRWFPEPICALLGAGPGWLAAGAAGGDRRRLWPHRVASRTGRASAAWRSAAPARASDQSFGGDCAQAPKGVCDLVPVTAGLISALDHR
jgi:hypothetical protein